MGSLNDDSRSTKEVYIDDCLKRAKSRIGSLGPWFSSGRIADCQSTHVPELLGTESSGTISGSLDVIELYLCTI